MDNGIYNVCKGNSHSCEYLSQNYEHYEKLTDKMLCLFSYDGM